jgi:carboxylesterase type B
MRDIRAALEWLQLNLEAFGGDPSKITIGGQSAGADAASAMLYQYLDDPIVRGIIQESGVPEYIGAADDSEFKRVAGIVGCANSVNRTAKLLCMKEIPSERLKYAISNLRLNPFGSSSGGNPMIDNITLFSAEEYQRRGGAGLFAKVVSHQRLRQYHAKLSQQPTLLGINNNEGDGVIPWSAHRGVNKTASDIITISYFNCQMLQEAL